MKAKRILAAFMALALGASVLTGCAGGSDPSGGSQSSTESTDAPAGEKVKLAFSIWSDEENYIRKVVDSYNASQDKIVVELNSIPNDDYDDKLKVMLSGGAELDIVDIRGMAQVTNYAVADSILDITDRIASSDLDVSNYGAMWDTSNVNGKYYSLPTRSTCWSLYYNKDLFDKAGLPYPENLTWDEYNALALELTEKLKDEKSADGSKIYGGFWVPWIYHFAAIQQGVYCTSDDTEPLRESLEIINEAWTNGSHISYAETKSGEFDYMAEFQNGRAAMIPNGEWCVNMLLQAQERGETDVNWEVAAMPIPDGVEEGTSWGQFQFAAVTKNCKYPDEAFDFLSYLCGEEGSKSYASSGMIHAYATEESEEEYKKTTGKDSVSVLFSAKKVQEQPNIEKYGEVVKIFEENADLYFLGEKTLDETMKNFEEQRAKALE